MLDINLILSLIPAYLGIGYTLHYGFNHSDPDWRMYYRWAVAWTALWPVLMLAAMAIWGNNEWRRRRKS